MHTQKPPNLTELFRGKLQSLNAQPYDPKNHSRITQFIQQVREGCDESEEEMDTPDVDDDIVLGHIQRSLNCPLTKKYFEDPVTSKSCNHSYSKAAILEHIKKRYKPKEKGIGSDCVVLACVKINIQFGAILGPNYTRNQTFVDDIVNQ